MCAKNPCPHTGRWKNGRIPLEETEHWARFLELDADPEMSLNRIATAMGVAPTTVSRWRKRADRLRAEPRKPIPDEVWTVVDRLVEDECPIREIYRTTGVRDNEIYRRYPNYRPGQTGANALMRLSSKIIGYPGGAGDFRPDALAG